ncbi:hypothetical protein D3C83_113450 [compost metagenome]
MINATTVVMITSVWAKPCEYDTPRCVKRYTQAMTSDRANARHSTKPTSTKVMLADRSPARSSSRNNWSTGFSAS